MHFFVMSQKIRNRHRLKSKEIRGIVETLEKEFPESYKIIADKENFQKFIKDSKKIINSQGIKVRDIVNH